MSFVSLLKSLVSNSKEFFLLVVRSQAFQSILKKLREFLVHPYALRALFFLVVVYIMLLLHRIIKQIDQKRVLKEKKQKGNQSKLNEILSNTEIKVFDQSFNEHDTRLLMSNIDQDSLELESNTSIANRHNQLSYIKFNYDDDTYEVMNRQDAQSQLQNQFKSEDNQYLNKIEQVLCLRKQKRKQNALTFLNDLQRKKEKVIVDKILHSDNGEKMIKAQKEQKQNMLRHIHNNKLLNEEEQMSVDSLSVVSADSNHTGHSRDPTKMNNYAVNKRRINLIEEVDVDDELSEDYESDAYIRNPNINQRKSIPSSQQNQSYSTDQNKMSVRVKDLKKKNDYLFFELFSIYTKQMIKDSGNQDLQ